MPNDYTELDAAIVASIKAGASRFMEINGELVARAAAKFENDKTPAWRFVDRRMQALRKAGKIKLGRLGWRVV